MAASGWWRVIFLVFNSLFLAIGVILYCLSIWILVTSDAQNKLDANGMIFTYSVLSASTFLVLIGVVGCVGGAIESICLLRTYVSLHSILIALEVGAAIGVHVALQRHLVEDPGSRGWKELGSPQRDFIQTQLQCCGYTNATAEYQDIPSSCHNETSGLVVTGGTVNVWQWNCQDRIGHWFNSHIPLWVTVIVLMVVIQLGSIVLSCLVLLRVEAACRVRPEPDPQPPVYEEKEKPPVSIYRPIQPIRPYNPWIRRNIQALRDPKVTVPPAQAKNIPIGQKRKRGRPKQAKPALIRQ